MNALPRVKQPSLHISMHTMARKDGGTLIPACIDEKNMSANAKVRQPTFLQGLEEHVLT